MRENLETAYTDLIRLAAEMMCHEGEPSIYLEEMQFCKSTSNKDKIRRLQDNETNHDITRHRAHRILNIVDKIRKEIRL